MGKFSKIFGVSLAALTFWVFVSRPGTPVEPGIIAPFYVLAALATVLVIGVVFFAMRVATTGATIYWSGRTGSKQIAMISLMIIIAIALQIAVGTAMDYRGFLDPVWSTVVMLVTWTLVPSAFLKLRLIQWPARLGSASIPKMLLAAAICIGVSAAWTYFVLSLEPVSVKTPSVPALIVMLSKVLAAAAMEEVVFRVLLLTALLDVAASRFQAVFLSGVAFALVHVPLTLGQPLMRGDWSMLQYAAIDYGPSFLWQVAFGLLFGVIWLRTGSITLVVLTHALTNLGEALTQSL